MRKIGYILCVFLLFIGGCGKKEYKTGIMYTDEDIPISIVKVSKMDSFSDKLIIIENSEQLTFALEKYSLLRDATVGFQYTTDVYSPDEYIYIIKYLKTLYASQTYSCEGIILDKQNGTVKFNVNTKKKLFDRAQEIGGYIVWAVFPKDELSEWDFSKLDYVEYPGEK